MFFSPSVLEDNFYDKGCREIFGKLLSEIHDFSASALEDNSYDKG